MSKQGRKPHQHTVARFHIRGFASAEGSVRQIDLQTGTRRLVSVSNAAVIKNFYSLTLSDGTRTDVWEDWLGDLENRVAPQVRRITASAEWTLSATERASLAQWIAVQYLRGTDNRRMMSETASVMWRMVVGMGGLAYLRHAMATGLGRDVSWPEAEAVWDDVHRPGGPEISVSASDHLETLDMAMEEATNFILGRSWHRVRFERHSLALNDTPVALVAADDHPDFLGIGLSNAAAITVALDRRTMLWLDDPAYPDMDLPPSVALSRMHNRAVVFGADRFVYTHPEDADPTATLDLSQPRRRALTPASIEDFANRDRPLADVLDQIESHSKGGATPTLIADYTWPIPGYAPPV